MQRAGSPRRWFLLLRCGSAGTYFGAMTCCLGRQVKGEVRLGGTMDKKLAGLLGAAAALTTMTAAQAAPARGSELPRATSYRDLLDPIPNALPLLKADDQRLAQSGTTRTAQVVVGHHPSPSSSPPSSRVVISREGHPFGCPSRMRASGGNAASVKAPRDGYARWAIEPAGLPGDILRQATSERAEPLNQISDQRDRGAPSHRQA